MNTQTISAEKIALLATYAGGVEKVHELYLKQDASRYYPAYNRVNITNLAIKAATVDIKPGQFTDNSYRCMIEYCCLIERIMRGIVVDLIIDDVLNEG